MNATGTARRYRGGVTRGADLMAAERAALRDGRVVVGVDEVGRGALAGPLAVGAVVVTRPRSAPEGLDDSKALTEREREALEAPLDGWATAWALGWASAQEIDWWGLRTALAVAASRALEGLGTRPDLCLVDGPVNLLRSSLQCPLDAPAPPPLAFADLECRPVVRGDATCATIAAASVLAKVARDRLMVELDARYPDYGWRRNKGYGAPEHLAALRRLGPSAEHRRSWRLPGLEEGPGEGPSEP